MIRFLAVVALTASLMGCQTSAPTVIQSTEYTCAAATAAIKTAVVFNDRLTPAQRQTVSRSIAVINPVCSQPVLPTVDSTLQAAMSGALTQLTSITSTLRVGP